jgi:coenzyme F420 hydrogenase subunit beta
MVTKAQGSTETGRGHRDLVNDVQNAGLCVYCGACAGSCPYLLAYNGRIVVLDNCNRTDGQCYKYCPRTYTDMDSVSKKLFGVPFSENEFGVAKEVVLARTTVKDIQGKGQDGSVVTTLLTTALEAGLIDAAVLAKMDADKVPNGYIARKEIIDCSRTSYEPCPTLQAINQLPDDSKEKLAVVSLPCHAAAVAKMKTYSAEHRINIDNVKLVVGLFCGWTLSQGIHEFMKQRFDLPNVVKFDIPHHPGHTMDAYYKDGSKQEVEIEEIRKYINTACSYCWDMTAELADVSVGSGRAKYHGWNTLIIRTEAGAKVVELAKKKGYLETQPIPEENIVNLRKACLNKKKKAIKALSEKYDGKQGYLGLSKAMVKKFSA